MQSGLLKPGERALQAGAAASAVPVPGGVEGDLLLDGVLRMFGRGLPVVAWMEALIDGLALLRSSLRSRVWKEFCAGCAAHPLAGFVHQDPLTQRAFAKPRGYPGDAKLIDFIYGAPNIAAELRAATSLGVSIFRVTRATPPCVAVRERRDIVARLVDETADRVREPAVLAIACGHLREVAVSRAAQEGRVARWLGLDQDPRTIAHVRGNNAAAFLDAREGSARDVIARRLDLGQFDLIYALGLFDHLPNKAAKRLIAAAFEMLVPGGTFLFANFASDIPHAGYMESFMAWKLILRDAAAMEDIMSAIPAADVAERATFFGANGQIVYAAVTKN